MNADQLLAIYASRIQEPPPRGLGRGTTTTAQLTEYGRRLFGTDSFRGVYPAGQTKVPKESDLVPLKRLQADNVHPPGGLP